MDSDKLSIISNNRIKYNILKIISCGIAVGLTLTGTISIVYILMYLYEIYNISILGCLLLDIILPSVYSNIVNCLIKQIDTKSEQIMLETEKLEEEYEIEQLINDVRMRFNALSRDMQVELLNYIKTNYLYKIEGFQKVNTLNEDEILLLLNDTDKVKLIDDNGGFSRKKTI